MILGSRLQRSQFGLGVCATTSRSAAISNHRVTPPNPTKWFGCKIQIQDFRFPSFPRKRESSKSLKKLDTCFHGYDDRSKFPAKTLKLNDHLTAILALCIFIILSIS
jgi:hypothetical protein